MTARLRSWVLFALLCLPAVARPQNAPVLPPGDKEPLLRLEAGGPTSHVNALAFSPDGKTLYAAGLDQVVRCWTIDPRTGRFVLSGTSYRVPIGPGRSGSINAVAVSADGNWLAVGGQGLARSLAGFREPGRIYPEVGYVSNDMRLDEGMIYLFNIADRSVHLLRGHTGAILALTFAQGQAAQQPPVLVSAGMEWDDKSAGYGLSLMAWDIDKKAVLKKVPFGSERVSRRPGLAAWRVGQAPAAIRVAATRGNGQLQVWDMATGERIASETDGTMDFALAYHPGQELLLSTGFRAGKGFLQGWGSTPDKPLSNVQQPNAEFPPTTESGKNVQFYPQTLTLLSSRPGGPLDRAAVILNVPALGYQCRLALVDLTGKSWKPLGASLPLWDGVRSGQSLAAVPGGTHLAVAGDQANHIQVYALADLLAGRSTAPQVLRSEGLAFQEVAFVTRTVNKQSESGIVLREGGRSLLFRPGSRSVTTDLKGWQADAPDATGWTSTTQQLDATPDQATYRVTINQNNKAVGQVVLKKARSEPRAKVLPRGPFRVPLVALAFVDEFNRPLLSLYNAESGVEVRRLTGHQQPIHSLAFRGDGRCLVSAAEDQIVCVWSLTDLNETLDVLGGLRGIAFKEQGRDLIVAHTDKESAAARAVPEGATLEALLDAGKTLRFTSARELYYQISLLRPGRDVTLRLVLSEGGKRDVTVKVDQGADERKPLANLFVTRMDRAGEHDWIGWSPNGPYDASTPRAERYLGWHFNTGKPDAPTAFARADQYRKEYQRPGILQYLLAEGSLSGALDSWKKEMERRRLPAPKTGMWFEELGPQPRRLQGRVLVQGLKAVTIKVAVNDFPADHLQSIQWCLNDGAWQDLPVGKDQLHQVALTKLGESRGRHRVRVRMVTDEFFPQTFTAELPFQTLPAPPSLDLSAGSPNAVAPNPPLRVSVRPAKQPAPEFRLEGGVKAHTPGQAVKLRLRKGDAGEAVDLRTLRDSGSLTFREEVRLTPGDNLFELVAVNADAAPETLALETTRRTLAVTYIEPEVVVPPPQIILERLTFADQSERLLEPGRALTTTQRQVVVHGQIVSAEPLESKTRTGKPLQDAKEEKQAQQTITRFRETLTLAPAEQKLHFEAKSKHSPVGSATLTLVYQPPVPQVVLTVPTRGLIVVEGKDAREIRVEGIWPEQEDPRDFQATLFVNEQPQRSPVEVFAKERRLTAAVTLQPGENRIQIRLANAWQATSLAETEVRYNRPPRILPIDSTVTTQKPEIDLVARVESPVGLPLTRAEVNGQLLSTNAFEEEKRTADLVTWKVTAKSLSLPRGKPTRFELQVSNEDGPALERRHWLVRFDPPPIPAPTIEILDPREDTVVENLSYRIRFRVRSEAPLRRVQILRQDQVVHAPEVARLSAQDGRYDVEHEVTLSPGNNVLKVVAVNEGGQQSVARTIACSVKPVRVVVDALEVRAQRDLQVDFKRRGDGVLTCASVAESTVVLKGKVAWLDKEDARLKKPARLRVWVNGFQQLPVFLQPATAGSLERQFRIDLVLNRAADNRIEIEAPDLKLDDEPRQCVIVEKCLKPVREQRLHLLIVRIGEGESRKLIDHALGVLDAKVHPRLKHLYQAPAFSEVHVYSPLTGYVSTGEIFDRLQLIKKTIEASSGGEGIHDVVMLYYQGGEAVTADGHYFLTSESQFDPELRRSAISCDGIASFFADTLGAQVLLFDVLRNRQAGPANQQDRIAHWPDDSHIGVMRYSWSSIKGVNDDARLLLTLTRAASNVAEASLGDLAGRLAAVTARMKDQLPLVFHNVIAPELKDIQIVTKPTTGGQ